MRSKISRMPGLVPMRLEKMTRPLVLAGADSLSLGSAMEDIHRCFRSHRSGACGLPGKFY